MKLKNIFAVMLIFGVMIACGASQAADFSTWTYRTKITFSGYDKNDTLTNFPLLVTLNTNIANFSYTQFTSPDNGGDLRFANSNETQELNYEIEQWDSASAAGFSPINLSGCVVWLTADTGVQADGSSVTNWQDQSGNGNNAIQANASLCPVIVTNTLNGKPVIRFDGMTNGTGDYMDIPAVTARTVIVVLNYLNGTNFPNCYPTAIGNQSTGDFIIRGRANLKILDAYLAAPGTRYINGKAIPIVNSGYDFNPVSAHKVVCVTLDYSTNLAARIGKDRTYNDQAWNGDIAEIIIYNRNLSLLEQNQVGYYLAQKYGLGTDYVTPGNSYVWVQTPELVKNGWIWAYWGNTTATAPDYSTNGATWSSEYAGVWHLKESGFPYADSTAARHDGTTGSVPICVQSDVGGPGQSFSGSTYPKIDVPYSSALNPATYTFSCRAKVLGGNNTYRSPITSRDGSPLRGYMLYANTNNVWTYFQGNGSAWVILNGGGMTTGQWAYLTGTYDGSKMRFFVNGSWYGPTTTIYSNNTARPLRIGAGMTENTGTYWFNGIVEEARVENVARSSNWVWACWMNTASNSLFAGYGKIEGKGPVFIVD
ncbi:MAG: LamG domain-containing protein [Kiritimatiellae bacterium]|nr:LamG domain-containing protein [Kiritimatiellia bacterium]MDD5521485.1 LamG domain-containing protein [Kiritimatiellia bacterium]